MRVCSGCFKVPACVHLSLGYLEVCVCITGCIGVFPLFLCVCVCVYLTGCLGAHLSLCVDLGVWGVVGKDSW